MAKITLTQEAVNDFRNFVNKFGMTVQELYNFGNNARVMEAEAVSRGFPSPHFVAPIRNDDNTMGQLPGVHAFAGTVVEVPNDSVPEDMHDHPLVDMSSEPAGNFDPQGNNLAAENEVLRARLAKLEAVQFVPDPKLNQNAPESSETPSKPRKADSK